MIYNFKKFSTLQDDIEKAKDIIEFERSKMINFGIDYLDDAFTGIAPNDLILIGGRSGGGKTELAINIAFNASLNKKKVFYFALEAETHEVGMRLLYKAKAQEYYNGARLMKEVVSFDRWIAKQMSDYFYSGFDTIGGALGCVENLSVRYVTDDYTVDDFVKDMESIKDEADLVIIDHLHYFEINEKNNENTEYKKIVKTIRTQCLEKNIPVILVSHIRKPDPRMVTFTPEQEDFHGSSDIIKISTKAITIGSGAGKVVTSPLGIDFTTDKYISFMKAVKHRRNGTVTHKMACVLFNQNTNSYEQGYYLGMPAYDSSNKRTVFLTNKKEDLPIWAQRAKEIK